MKTIRSVYVWGIALIYFGCLLASLLIRSKFQSQILLHELLRRRLLFLFKLIGVDLHIEFEEEIPAEQPVIFMANHSSLIDIPLLQATIPGRFKGILSDHQFNYFLYGSAVRSMGHIAIDRNHVRRSLRAFQQATECLRAGTNIVVLPEGGRSVTGQLLPFKKLPFRFAKDSGAAIVPIGISGVFNMKNKGSWHLTPGKISIRFGAILAAGEVAKLEINELREQLSTSMRDLLDPFEAGE